MFERLLKLCNEVKCEIMMGEGMAYDEDGGEIEDDGLECMSRSEEDACF